MILDEVVKVHVRVVRFEGSHGRELFVNRKEQHDNQFDSAKLPGAECDGADAGLFMSGSDLSDKGQNVRD